MENDTTQKNLELATFIAKKLWPDEPYEPDGKRFSVDKLLLESIPEIEQFIFSRQPATTSGERFSTFRDEAYALTSEIVGCLRTLHGHDFTVCAQGAVEEIICRHLLSRTVSPVYHKTADNPPTEADFKDGNVLAWGWRSEAWMWADKRMMSLSQDGRFNYPYWMPVPPAPVPPVSEEDTARQAAFEARFKGELLPISSGKIDTFNAAWDAAKAYFESKKDSGK